MNNWTEREYRLATFTRIWWWFPLTIIIIIGLFKECTNSSDSIDNSVNASRQIVAHVEVLDITSNGFRVVYATRNAVSNERFKEICERPHIINGFKKLQTEAPAHFGNMLYTDIYDFARFAKKYDIDEDILIHNIFVVGMRKCKLYIGSNPKITNAATWYNPNTEQGILYLKKNDVYNTLDTSKRIYRYWKCQSIYSYSYVDEQFSHFSEDERIW